MIKQLRVIIIAAIALVVILGGVLFVSVSPIFHKSPSSSSSGVSSASSISIIKTDANNITKIKITNSTGSYTIVKTAANTWVIDQMDASIYTSDSISNIATSTAKFNASKIIVKDPKDLSAYGLDKPLATVEITISGQVRTLLIGKKTPLSDGYYFMEKGISTVYTVPNSTPDNYLNSVLSYVNTSLLIVDQTNDVPKISSYSFGGSARTSPIDITQVETSSSTSSSAASIGTGYKITQPLTIDAGSDQLSKLNQSLASISADSCVSTDVSNGNLKNYGLDNPKYTFSVTVNAKTTKLLFGNTVSVSGTDYIYAMLSGRNAVFRVALSSVPFYKDSLIDLASPLQFIYMVDDVKSIIVQSGTDKYQFDLTGTSDSLVVKCGSKALTTQFFRDYYQTLIGIGIEGETSLPQNPQLLCKVTFVFRDSKKPNSVSEFYAMNGSNCAWSINGITRFYTLRSNVNNLISNTQKISNNQDVVTY